MRFIVDSNVGRLARWLRIAGFDTLFMKGIDDNRLVRMALDENRVLLTKDTRMMERRVIANGRLKAILIEADDVMSQVRQVFTTLDLRSELNPFSLCVECNMPLLSRTKEEVRGLVPPYVYQIQTEFMQCPECKRFYWKGTHWEKMHRELEAITGTA